MMPFLTKEMDTSASQYKIKAYARTWTLVEIKQALNAGHMNLTVFWVGTNWTDHYGDHNIQPTTDRLGLHAVVLCGYDDTRQAFRGVNSWGEDNWGDNGFFWIDYGCFPRDLGEAWAVEVVETIPEPIPDTFWETLLKLLKLLIDAIKKWSGGR